MVVGNEAHEQRDQDDHALLGVRVDGERLQRDDREQEDDREPGEQDVERDLVRRLLAFRALDERDHPVEEALAGYGGDTHHDLVGETRVPPVTASGRRRTRGSRVPTRR